MTTTEALDAINDRLDVGAVLVEKGRVRCVVNGTRLLLDGPDCRRMAEAFAALADAQAPGKPEEKPR